MREIINSKIFMVIFIGLITIFGCRTLNEEKKAKYLLAQCKNIKLGMSCSQLKEIMGPPVKIKQFTKDGRVKERYIYISPRLAATYTQCVIDKDSCIVEEVQCGENYSLP